MIIPEGSKVHYEIATCTGASCPEVSPVADGTSVTMTCTGVEAGSTLASTGLTCGSESSNEVVCTGTVGSDSLTSSDQDVTITCLLYTSPSPRDA